MATREAQMLQQMLDPNQPNPGEDDLPTATVSNENEFINPGGEIELTDEIRGKVPVINNARNSNKMSGMADFLSNPVVQNALMQFGRAFSQNREGEAGTVLADAGQQFLQRNANQNALEAAEAGEPIAEAAGQFADPEMVANLQQRKQQQDQFEQEMELASEGLDIDRSRLEADAGYRLAKLNQDKSLAEDRISNLEEQTKIDRMVGRARANLMNAQADAVGQEDGFSFMSIDPEKISDYQDMLKRQEGVIKQGKQQLQEQLDSMPYSQIFERSLTREEAKKYSETFDAANLVELAEKAGIPKSKDYQALERQIEAYDDRLAQSKESQMLIENVINQNLGGGGVGGPSTFAGGDTDSPDDQQAQGSVDNPVQVTVVESRNLPANSIASIGGSLYRINDDGTKTPLDEDGNPITR